MNQTFNIHHLFYLLYGTVWTIALSLIGFAGGGLLGAVVALGRISSRRWCRGLFAAYVQLIQGTPLLVLMFLSYFGLGISGIDVPVLVAAGVAMSLYASAYLGEIWRSSLQAVPRTQWEASECLSFSRTDQLCLIVVPQALRIATPPTVGFLVQIVKNSSLASVVGLIELARVGQVVNNTLFEPLPVFSITAALYFLLCYPLSVWAGRLESRASIGSRVALGS